MKCTKSLVKKSIILSMHSLTKESIRTQLERPSILSFMEQNKSLLSGRVLDYGAGKQPYKHLVSGEYEAYDISYTDLTMPRGSFDAIMCNQMIQYVMEPLSLFNFFFEKLKSGGHLVMTYPTHWEEVEDNDIYRFTKRGMEFLLSSVGFEIIKHEERCRISFEDFHLAIGYGIIARKN